MKQFGLLFCAFFCVMSVWGTELAHFPKNSFFFGVATAPAQVEDGLEDTWLDFAHQKKIAAYENHYAPEERLRFWTEYKREIDLIASTGVQVFRLGVDWGRLVPERPDYKTCSVSGGVQDKNALLHYDEIIDYAKSKNLKVMMTLFHHSAPRWFNETGGWTQKYASDCFVKFSQDVIKHFSDRVSYWITFNEPALYNLFVTVGGFWPPGFSPARNYELISIPGIYKGRFERSNLAMVSAHKRLFSYIHNDLKIETPVGIAHNIGYHMPTNYLSLASVYLTRQFMNYHFMDMIADKVDFMGLNYYGAEYLRGLGSILQEGVEYSDSGRAIYPYGLYALLKDFNNRYNRHFTNRKTRNQLPIIITENGIAETGDTLRPSYMIEHLLAIKQAMREGINVLGYIVWTITDNLEWTDGYCPQFGLFAVDRKNNLERIPRPYSVPLIKSLTKTGIITSDERDSAWNRVELAQNSGALRTMCRSEDGQTALDVPILKYYVKQDWRFAPNRPLHFVYQ